ncbi:MAG: cell shape-determining protein MreC [Candidatus Binatia bacterium]|nr:MAG: cell shape-determining protein MreC [Candidatus Binatia bacterium]
MLEFLRRNQVVLTSGCLLLLSLVLVSSSSRGRLDREPVSAFLLEAARPVQAVVTGTAHAVERFWRRYLALVGLARENEVLRQRILDLERQAVRLAEVRETNRRLRALLEFREAVEGESVVARIVGKDPSPWFRTFTIDKGELDGVRQGMAVLSPYGAVGRVIRATDRAARVLLLTDHASGVDALVQRSRARGIVEGEPGGTCVMKYVRSGEDVRPGDRVVTSGFDGIFPKGIVIGEVKAVRPGARGLMLEAVVEPSAPFDRLEEVLVVDPSAYVGPKP